MGKRKPAEPSKLRPGRPREAHGAGVGAPQITLRLDLHAEAAVAALRATWADEDGPLAAAAALKRAAIEAAERQAPKPYAAALARIRSRRDADVE